MLSDQPAAERRHPGKVPAAVGVVSPRTACPKTLSGPSIRAHRRIGGASGVVQVKNILQPNLNLHRFISTAA